MSKYSPLHDHLRALIGQEAPMTFAEIEQVLGFRLPASARSYPAWWSNTHHNPAVSAWRTAGWLSSQVDLGRERLVFTREAVRPKASTGERSAAADDAIQLNLSDLSPLARTYFRHKASEAGGVAEAVTRFINAEITTPRKRLLDRFSARSPRLSDDSTTLIREDRDER